MMKHIEWNIDPVAFWVSEVPIMYYSILLIAGTILSVWILKRVYRANGIPWENLQILVMLSIAGLFLGARLGHCLIYDYEYYFAHPLEILLPIRIKPDEGVVFVGYQGMASHGGLVGWIVAMVVYSRMTGEKILRTLDLIALVLPLAACFIRLGNFMNSEIVGIPTNVPWAFVFEQVDALPRHPAQVYEALAYLAIFGLNMLLYRRVGLDRYRGMFLGVTLTLVFYGSFFDRVFEGKAGVLRGSDGAGCGTGVKYPFYYSRYIFFHSGSV